MTGALILLIAGYTALIVYGSLFPFTGWSASGADLLRFLDAQAADYSTSDVVANVLAYIPLGVLLGWTRSKARPVTAIVVAGIAAAGLSSLMELFQQFIPTRVPSAIDVISDTCGALLGAVTACLLRNDRLPYLDWRNRWAKPGLQFDLGLAVIGIWALSQLTPLVPSLDIGHLRQGLAPLWHTMRDLERFNAMQCAVYALSISGLALLFTTLTAPGRPALRIFFGFVAAVLLCKILVVGRQLSLEAITGATAAALLVAGFVALRKAVVASISAVLVLGAFVCAEVSFDPAASRHPFNWVPFLGALQDPLPGFNSILDAFWPSFALGYLARLTTASTYRSSVIWGGGAALALIAFALEWSQQHLPGRYGSIGTVLVFAGGWFLAWVNPAGKPKGFAGLAVRSRKLAT